MSEVYMPDCRGYMRGYMPDCGSSLLLSERALSRQSGYVHKAHRQCPSVCLYSALLGGAVAAKAHAQGSIVVERVQEGGEFGLGHWMRAIR